MEGIDMREFFKMQKEIEMDEARKMAPYRISVGQALLNDDELNEKWAKFVNFSSNDKFYSGTHLDEMLQIIGMVKAGVPSEKIKEALSNYGSKGTLIHYLKEFIDPEIISEIETDNSKDKGVEI